MLVVYLAMQCYFSSMKKLLIFSSILIACNLASTATAEVDAKAERIVKGVRLATKLQQNDLNGTLRKNGKRTPIGLFLRGKDIQFQYKKNKQWQIFHMRLNQNNFDLFEIINGKNVKFATQKLSQPIMGTDLTYEDLAFRFLYWPNAQIVGEDTIKLQKCHKIRLINPGEGGKYDIVYLWVHQKFNALMQVVGYNKNGKILKRFHVTELMKVDKGQTLKKMNVETFNPATEKAVGITYLELEKPKPIRKGLGGPPKK